VKGRGGHTCELPFGWYLCFSTLLGKQLPSKVASSFNPSPPQ
jgi:hypothetical protein